MGDAMTWICLLRLVTSWFPGRRIPLVTALSGTLGQLGAIGAAAPMTWALGHLGWTKAYLVAAAVSVVAAPRWPSSSTTRRRSGASRAPADLRDDPREPAGELGAARHPARLLDALRDPVQRHRDDPAVGLPVPGRGEGLSAARASLLLSLVVVAVMYSGPTIGWLIGRHPWHRSTTVLVIVWAIVAVWTVVLAWPGTHRSGCWWSSPRSSGSAARPR